MDLPATRDAALAAVRSWGKRRRALDEERGPLIRAVLRRKLATKEEIHQATGLGRTTIDRIAASQPDGSSTASDESATKR